MWGRFNHAISSLFVLNCSLPCSSRSPVHLSVSLLASLACRVAHLHATRTQAHTGSPPRCIAVSLPCLIVLLYRQAVDLASSTNCSHSLFVRACFSVLCTHTHIHTQSVCMRPATRESLDDQARAACLCACVPCRCQSRIQQALLGVYI